MSLTNRTMKTVVCDHTDLFSGERKEWDICTTGIIILEDSLIIKASHQIIKATPFNSHI